MLENGRGSGGPDQVEALDRAEGVPSSTMRTTWTWSSSSAARASATLAVAGRVFGQWTITSATVRPTSSAGVSSTIDSSR